MYQKALSIILVFSVLLAIGAPALNFSALNLSIFKSNIAFASATVGTSPVMSLTQGLVGYWTFDGQHTNWATGKTFDQSGNGNTGTMTNMSSNNVPAVGKLGQAFKFDGVNDYVNVPSSAVLAPTESITFAAWVKPNMGSLNALREIYRNDNSSGDNNRHLFSFQNPANCSGGGGTGGCIAFGINTSGTYGEVDPNIAKTDWEGRWSLVVATYDGATKKIYQNGVQIGSVVASGAIGQPLTSNNAAIGRYQTNSEFFFGLIDDVRIYNRALSVTEVAKLYQLGQAKFANSPVTSMTSGLVGYWTFDGQNTNWATGKTFDQSGNGKTGTMTNMTTSTTPVTGKLGQAFKFDGVDDYVSAGSVASSIKTVSFWVKASDTTKKIIDLNGTATIEAIGGVITANNFTIPTVYVNGVVSGGQGTETFTTTGAGTWTAPSGSISVFAETWAGGGGGGLPGLGSNKSGGGGAGGGYSAVATSVTPGTTYDLYVGAGGDITGSAGEDSWFSNSSVVLSKGGGAGGTGPNGAGGTAGAGAIGTTLYSGGDGAAGVDASYSGGGGGGAGSAGNGGVAATSTAGSGGSPDGGAGGAGRTTNGSGNAGSTLGGGGSGAMKGDSGFMLGGAGAQGQVKLTYTISGPAISPGVWYHVVITTPAAINGSAVDIGRISAGYFAGQIDDVRIYNRALSAREAQTLYQLGTAKFANSPVTSLASGLVGYWTLDGQHTNWATGKTFDQSGNGNTGTMTNMTTSTTPVAGKLGQAFKLDGVNDYVAMGDVLDITSTSVPLTISAWVKKNDSAGIEQIASKQDFDAPYSGYGLYFNETNLAFDLIKTYSTDTLITYASGFNASTIRGKWAFIAVTYSGSKAYTGVKFYVNGTAYAGTLVVNTLSTEDISSSLPFEVGARDANKYPFFGQIDDVRIYNKALSAREIQTLYNLGR